jgi:hypothetical protein
MTASKHSQDGTVGYFKNKTETGGTFAPPPPTADLRLKLLAKRIIIFNLFSLSCFEKN